MTRTALYRHFDEAGNLLYVGISLSAMHRLEQHRRESWWFRQICTVTIEWYESRALALQAEALSIAAENPAFNVKRPGPDALDLGGFAVRHAASGRLDGWYGDHSTATHIVGWFQAMFPRDRFALCARLRGAGRNRITHTNELKWTNWEGWAAAAPDHAAGDAFDRRSLEVAD